MAIISNAKGYTNDVYLNLFPDQYVSEKEKQTELWIKTNMDYFSNVAYQQYYNNSTTFVGNYNLLKGIINRSDFYEMPEVQSFMDTLEKDMKLPEYVKHYSILNSPINTLVGESSRRPDNVRVRAMDDDSKAEQLQYNTQMLQQYLQQIILTKIKSQLAQQGIDIEDEEFSDQIQQITLEQLQENMKNYTSMAESWGNHILEALKVGFNIKEKSEEAFRDLLVCAREHFHIYEDNSPMGFGCEVLNPKNVWSLTTPDKKYTRDAFASGYIMLMELSEVLDKFNLTQEEVDHLRKGLRGYYQYGIARESNLVNGNAPTGSKSVTYDTYDPLVEQQRQFIESQLQSNNIQLENYLGIGQNNIMNSFGTKVVVTQAYWKSKRKVGKLTYLDPETNSEQTVLVSEDYKKIPGEIDIEWGYINQWWKGTKIGQDVYINVEPFNLFNYNPIIGVTHEIKNTEARSLVDLMKPFQVIYNVCMNKLYRLLEKDFGKVILTSIRHLPKLKDQDESDAIEQWELMAKEKGIIFIDDSPENLEAPSSFNQHAAVDLSRTAEIQGYYNLAAQIKQECWELVGITRQRTGQIAASETATATNTALSQSYTQTEPYFVQHEYVMNQFYQALLDAAQYIEVQKPQSTVSYINNIGEQAFIQVNQADIKLKDLQVFATSRVEDQRIFNELRQLAQPMLQNGASIYDVSMLYATNSIRQMQQTFKILKDKQDQFQAQQQQIEQQQLQQQQEQFEAAQAQAYQDKLEDRANENYNKELDRINEKEVAIIKSLGFGKVQGEDLNANGTPDIMESARLTLDTTTAQRNHDIEIQRLQLERQKALDARNKDIMDAKSQEEDRKVARENMKNDLQIAKENAKGRAKKAAATKKKK